MPLHGVGAIAEPALCSLGGAETVWASSELPLEIGERNLPEFVLGLAIRRHRQSLWSPPSRSFDFSVVVDAPGLRFICRSWVIQQNAAFADGLPSLGALRRDRHDGLAPFGAVAPLRTLLFGLPRVARRQALRVIRQRHPHRPDLRPA